MTRKKMSICILHFRMQKYIRDNPLYESDAFDHMKVDSSNVRAQHRHDAKSSDTMKRLTSSEHSSKKNKIPKLVPGSASQTVIDLTEDNLLSSAVLKTSLCAGDNSGSDVVLPNNDNAVDQPMTSPYSVISDNSRDSDIVAFGDVDEIQAHDVAASAVETVVVDDTSNNSAENIPEQASKELGDLETVQSTKSAPVHQSELKCSDGVAPVVTGVDQTVPSSNVGEVICDEFKEPDAVCSDVSVTGVVRETAKIVDSIPSPSGVAKINDDAPTSETRLALSTVNDVDIVSEFRLVRATSVSSADMCDSDNFANETANLKENADITVSHSAEDAKRGSLTESIIAECPNVQSDEISVTASIADNNSDYLKPSSMETDLRDPATDNTFAIDVDSDNTEPMIDDDDDFEVELL